MSSGESTDVGGPAAGPCRDLGATIARLPAPTLRVGDVEVIALLDSVVACDVRAFLPDHFDEYLDEQVVPDGRSPEVALPTICWLVKSAGKVILVDSGIGNRRRVGEAFGHLDDRLREVGVNPADVDVVVNTHLHNDHVGWNTVRGDNGVPRAFFERAEYLVQEEEWTYWSQPDLLTDPANHHLQECVGDLVTAGRVRLVHPHTFITQELGFVSTPGHTPGHVAIEIYSSGERALLLGDSTHLVAQLDHPDWSPIWDTDGAQAAHARDYLFDLAATDGRLVLANHWPYPGVGHIVRVEGRRTYSAC